MRSDRFDGMNPGSGADGANRRSGVEPPGAKIDEHELWLGIGHQFRELIHRPGDRDRGVVPLGQRLKPRCEEEVLHQRHYLSSNVAAAPFFF